MTISKKLMVQGKVEGTRPRGHSPKRWLDQVKQFTGNSFQDSIKSTSDREEWRKTAKNTHNMRLT